MDNQKSILSGNAEDLKKVSEKLKTLESLEQQIDRSHLDKQRLEKDIEAEEKLLSDHIDSTIKKRREELTATFDKEIQKDQNRLKTIRNNREKAKSKGVKERILSETDDLTMENKRIHEEIRTVFKQKGVPKFCDSRMFYLMYYPKSITERLVALLIWAAALVGIPFAINMLLSWPGWGEIILWIAVDLIFVSIYITIRMKTKDIYHSTFVAMRANRNIIDKNRSKIREIKKHIKKDKDEEQYNLGSFDAEMMKIEEIINQEAERKSHALADFDANMKQVIITEITNQDKDRIEKLKEKAAALAAGVLELERHSKELRADIMSEYGTYVGAEFMSVDKTRELIIIIEEGRASTVHEARDQYLQK